MADVDLDYRREYQLELLAHSDTSKRAADAEARVRSLEGMLGDFSDMLDDKDKDLLLYESRAARQAKAQAWIDHFGWLLYASWKSGNGDRRLVDQACEALRDVLGPK